MRSRWLGGIAVGLVCALACKEKQVANHTPAIASSPQVPASPASSTTLPRVVSSSRCSPSFEYLVPPQRSEDGAISAIVADGDQVYFRNQKQVYRVPLSGGQPTLVSNLPPISSPISGSLYISGERLLIQALGEPVFLTSPKSGGAWSPIIDSTRKGASVSIASEAVFDGSHFYWAEGGTKSDDPNAPAVLRSVALADRKPRTIFRRTGDIDEVTIAGDQVVFLYTEPPSAEQLRLVAEERRHRTQAFPVRGEQHLMSVPIAGGDAKPLADVSKFVADVILGTDGSSVYFSCSTGRTWAKRGIYRTDTNGSTPERIDERDLQGRVLVAGSNVIFAGNIQLEPGSGTLRQAVLSMPRDGARLELVDCASGNVSGAYAVAGKYLLMSLFDMGTQKASVAKIALP
jgi:hypothetical protein